MSCLSLWARSAISGISGWSPKSQSSVAWMFCDATRPLFGPSYERHLPRMSPNVAANHASEMHRSRPRMKSCPPQKKTNLTQNTQRQCFKNNYVIYHIFLQFSTVFYRISKFKAIRPTLKSYKVLVKAESGVLPLTVADTGQQDQQELRSSMKSNEVIMSLIHDWLMSG